MYRGYQLTLVSFAPLAKRRKVGTKSKEQALYESKVLDQTFSRLGQSLQDDWSQYNMSLNTDFMFTGSHDNPSQMVGPDTKYPGGRSESTPTEELFCKWQNEDTG